MGISLPIHDLRGGVSGLRSVTLGAGLVLAASTTVACASGPSGSTAPAPAPSSAGSTTTGAVSAPHITVQRSGGFAGLKDTIDLAPSGTWTATTKGGAQRSGELAPEQTTRIHTLAADPRIAAEAAASRPPTRCRDAFSYILTVGAVRVVFVDCPSDPGQPAASLALVKQVLSATIQPAR